MARTLTLIRHAKSGWDDQLRNDHERTLTDRGVSAATAMGQYLTEQGITFDLVLCSDARRTMQTADLLLNAMVCNATTTFSHALYLAGADQMLAQIIRHDASRIAVIGHNPGIAQLAALLASAAPDHRRFHDYPSCAVTHLAFDRIIAPRLAEVKLFATPADLKA